MLNKEVENLSNDLWRMTPCRVGEKLSGGKFVRFKHIEYISRIIAQTVAHGNGRLIVSIPPRHGKSWLISTWTPPWFLGLCPDKSIILTSYEAEFASSWGRRVRDIIREHGEVLGVTLRDDSQASDRWQTTVGGGMITAGVGGPITGRGGDLIIIDDPVKNWQEATSEVQRKKAIEWFNSTLYTRAEPGASIIILMTRWHEDDLAGNLLGRHNDTWKEIRLPALAEDGDALGRPVGAALCPERYDEEALYSIQRTIGSRAWNALYQQRPSAEEGNIFKRQWWQFYDDFNLPFEFLLQSWDLSFKETKTSDYVVGQVWGRIGGKFYLVDQVRARMDFPTTIRAIREMTAKFPNAMLKLIEDKANGPAIVDMLSGEIPGIVAVEPLGTKEARASAISPLVEAGNVYLPNPNRCGWVNEFVDEFANFPTGKHDDQVDAASQGLIRLNVTAPGFMPFSIERLDVFSIGDLFW
jgi:predicted phage terminase large subunit-like protein